MNRIEHPSFPDTLAGIIYENGAFTALVDGQFNEPIADSAYDAARDALSGWDPTGDVFTIIIRKRQAISL